MSHLYYFCKMLKYTGNLPKYAEIKNNAKKKFSNYFHAVTLVNREKIMYNSTGNKSTALKEKLL